LHGGKTGLKAFIQLIEALRVNKVIGINDNHQLMLPLKIS